MDKYTTYVGMDVHARSITARAMVKETGETFSKRLSDCPGAEDVASWLSSLPQPAYCAYESGCTGTQLARNLRALGANEALAHYVRRVKEAEAEARAMRARVQAVCRRVH